VFTGGLFLSTALFLLISQGNFLTFHFRKERSKAYLVPISDFISFFSFALLLFIEKVAFDSKVLQPFQGTKNKKPSGAQKNKEEENIIVSKDSHKEKLVVKNEAKGEIENEQEISLENNNGKIYKLFQNLKKAMKMKTFLGIFYLLKEKWLLFF
jgi:hypothetical protein